MADTKISALTALTGASVDTTADVLPIVDTSATTTKKILIDELRIALNTYAGQAQTFLGSDVALNNTANYFNIVNTGSIGASGQVWLIIGVVTLDDINSGATMRVRLWDTSTVFAEIVTTVPALSSPVTATIVALVSPSGAATYHLSAKDASSGGGFARTTSTAGTANKATSITAIRLL